MGLDIALDHVAVATEDREPLLARYRGELGGSFAHGGEDPGFWWGQIRFANQMKVEILEPHAVELNDFLRRFLDRNGPGPHHLTFKVSDIVEMLERVDAIGYPVMNVNLEHALWKEAFIHPKSASGIVVQLAQSAEIEDYSIGERAATLVHVAHAVTSLDEGLRLFRDALGGTELARGDDFADLEWPGTGRVRLMLDHAWVGDRPGRVHHIAFVVSDPQSVSGAVQRGSKWEVEPHLNLGTRLFLATDAEAFRA